MCDFAQELYKIPMYVTFFIKFSLKQNINDVSFKRFLLT